MKISDSISKSTAENIEEAVKILQNGGIISFPTETYYGLGVDPFNTTAVNRLYQLKQREKSKPILVLVSDTEMLSLLVSRIPEQYTDLMETYWPGPLTLVFPANETVSPLLTGQTGTIGIRISSNPIVKEIFKKWRKPLTATSANLSTHAPAQSSSEVLSYFGENIDYFIDGGEAPAGLCSSIVAFENDRFIEIRKGQIPFSEMIAKVKK